MFALHLRWYSMKHIHIFKNFITLFTAAAVLLVFISCEQISGGGGKDLLIFVIWF